MTPKLTRCALVLALVCLIPTFANAEFKAGATVVDVTPDKFPVLVNGGMLSRTVDVVKTRVNARALALSDGKVKVVIVVVDSCMMPRPLLDEAKAMASKKLGIPAHRLLISATHTHSAPSCMGALGTDADPKYPAFLKTKLVEAIESALKKMQPARVGFGKADASEFTALRRWIRRPDRLALDPFGNPTVRANMHSANKWDDVTGQSGPEDPDLSMISIQSKAGKPIAVLANFSMHYFSGERGISADYFGLFCEGLKKKVAEGQDFVGILSHGCSGDIWRRDYSLPKDKRGDDRKIDDYTRNLLEIAMQAYRSIKYRDDADLAMAEKRMTLKYRTPNKQMLEWAQRVVKEMGDRPPKSTTEVYAREQIILHERQQTEIVLQGLRIGDIAIATTPNETYAITGLKIKAASPAKQTMVIELANGGDGYVPPPEQHLFGGYNTWAARSAGLEVMAEPKITEGCIALLEKVTGKPRRESESSKGNAALAIEKSKPIAWYRLDEFTGPRALDSSGNERDAIYEPAITFYLKGPHSEYFCKGEEKNRSAMFVGGRLRSHFRQFGTQYSVSLWVWNGMPNKGREVSGWLFSRGHNNGLSAWSDHLGIGGTSGNSGKLIFFHGDDPSKVIGGKTEIPRWTWQHVVFVRDGKTVRVYLNGELEIETEADADFPKGSAKFFLGGRSDNSMNWEGRLDEISLYNRALTSEEVKQLVVKP